MAAASETTGAPSPLPSGDTRCSNALSELRKFSAALSTFLRRHDELQQHLDFIQTAIDSKLSAHQPASIDNLTETLGPTTEQLSPRHSPKPWPSVPVIETLASATKDSLRILSSDPSSSQKLPIVSPSETLPSATGEKTLDDDKSRKTEIELLCLTMASKNLRKYVCSNLSNVDKLRQEVPVALKLAPHPAQFVLKCFGRFFQQGIRAYQGKSQHIIAGRQASLLILEFFLLMDREDIEINDITKEEAQLAAVRWKKRLEDEGGLGRACEADCRGLLLLIGSFGIPKVFTAWDITDLIIASNASKISDALRRSQVLLERVPVIIEKLVRKKDHKVVDIIYAFGMEKRFPPRPILSSIVQVFIETWNKARQAAHGSLEAQKEANRSFLVHLKYVWSCLEEYKIDCSEILPDFPIAEKIATLQSEISDLEKKIADEKVALKRRLDEINCSKKSERREEKRPRFCDPEPQHHLTPIRVLDNAFPGCLSVPGQVSNPYPSSYEVLRPLPEIRGGLLVDKVGQVTASNGDSYEDSVLRGRVIGHSCTERSGLGVNGLLSQTASLDRLSRLPNPLGIGASNRAPASKSDLYQFADAVAERELFGDTRAVPSSFPAHHSSNSYSARRTLA